jgi:YesN/AraC family two-component response regulator
MIAAFDFFREHRKGRGIFLLNLMIVDDEQSILDLFDMTQEIYNFRVVATAKDGEEALLKYPRVIPRPDIVLMDQHMPKMTGIECMRKILQIDPKANIVFLSVDDSVKEEALKLGAIDFVKKPFHMKELIHQLSLIVQAMK